MHEIKQPMIPALYRLLKHGYPVGALMLDLFGTFDEDGYEVIAVSLSGTRVDLNELVPQKVLDDATNWCNEKLPDCTALLQALRYEAQIDRNEWERTA